MANQVTLYPELDYVGVTKLRGEWHIFYAVLEMWILDYKKYRPSYNPPSDGWRANLLVIDSNMAEQYCQAMSELSREDIRQTLYELPGKDGQPTYSKPPLVFVVDFDNTLFVNGWWELIIPFHKLIPAGWKGIEGDPYKYVPADLKELWL